MTNTVKVIEVVSSSEKSWEDAAENAVRDAGETLRNIVGLDVINQTAKIEGGKITKFKMTVKIAFEVEK